MASPSRIQDDIDRITSVSSEDTIASVKNGESIAAIKQTKVTSVKMKPVDQDHLFSSESAGNNQPTPNGGNPLNVQNGTVENVTFKKSHSIFKIPEFLTRNKQNSYGYQPKIVLIGPYHKGKPELQSIQEQKKKFEKFFVSQANREGVSMDDLVRAVSLKEQEIRDSYSEDLVEFPSEVLMDMLILDGCFLLTLFLTVAKNINYEDPIFNLPWVLSAIQRDLLLLENQIPLFVLQTLLTTAKFPPTIGVITIALTFFGFKRRKIRAINNRCDAKHLLDLIRNTYIPISRQTTISGLESGTNSPSAPNDSLKLILSAEKLRDRGIKFKLKTNMEDTFLDISLNISKLEIPELILDDFMSLLILNCIAFEQFCADTPNHVTSYAIFMGCLINSKKDAALLEEEGIIPNSYGTQDEVSRFFKRITKDYAFDIKKSYLAPVFVGVTEYTANGFHVQWAKLKYTYSGFPLITFFLGLIALELSIIQSLYASGILPTASINGSGG